jgi:hypothetical protein
VSLSRRNRSELTTRSFPDIADSVKPLRLQERFCFAYGGSRKETHAIIRYLRVGY